MEAAREGHEDVVQLLVDYGKHQYTLYTKYRLV